MKQCALCGTELTQDSQTVLCPDCQESNWQRLRRKASFDAAWSAVHIALNRLEDFQIAYPDAALLVQQLKTSITLTLPPIDTIHQDMQQRDDEISKLLYVALGYRKSMQHDTAD